MLLKGCDRAFCAGGDVRGLRDAGLAGQPECVAFIREEYALNYLSATSAVPQVSIWRGIVMGGGAGISVHGRFRVATETVQFAMPETMIGLIPDVGASYFLGRLAGGLGMYIGLTGYRLDVYELLALGLATHFVPAAALPALEAALLERCASSTSDRAELAAEIEQTIDLLSVSSMTAEEVEQHKLSIKNCKLSSMTAAIDKCFGHAVASLDAVLDILASMAQEEDTWAIDTLATLNRCSPTSLHLTFRAINAGRQGLALGACLKMEHRVMRKQLENTSSDFYEGVRAQLVDKDRNPRWQPPSLDVVHDLAGFDAHFQTIGDEELVLP